MIPMILGVIIAIILATIGILALVAILEILKYATVAAVIIFSFLWLSTFIKKEFKIDKRVSLILGGIISVLLGIAVYQSWWAIMILSILLLVGYAAWEYFGGENLVSAIKKYLK